MNARIVSCEKVYGNSFVSLLPFDCNIAGTSRPAKNQRSRSQGQTLRRFGGRHPLCGMGVTSRIEFTLIPAWLTALIADSRPPPGPLTRTSTSRIPASTALRATSEAACCAANGVPFREPRKPRAPDEDCATKLPLASVIEINVLLKEAEM